MTKWYVALPFVLLGFVGMVGVIGGLSGSVAGFLFGVPALAVSIWFMGTKYESRTARSRH